MKDDPEQLHWKPSWTAINLLMSILVTKELKLNILKQIVFLKLQTILGKAKSRLLSFEIDFSQLLLKMEKKFMNSIALLPKAIWQRFPGFPI